MTHLAQLLARGALVGASATGNYVGAVGNWSSSYAPPFTYHEDFSSQIPTGERLLRRWQHLIATEMPYLAAIKLQQPDANTRRFVEQSSEVARLAAPTEAARLVASAVILAASTASLMPDRISATADRGVMFYFFDRTGGRRFASLESHDDGTLVLLLADRGTAALPQVEEVTVSRPGFAAAYEKIQEFIGAASCLGL